MALSLLEARRETTGAPGTSTAAASAFATKTCYIPAVSFDFDAGGSMLYRDDEMRQQNEPLRFDPESFAPTWSMETRLYPDSAAFLLNGVIAVVTTAGDGVITDLGGATIPVGAYRHRFAAPYSSGTLPRTFAFRACYADESQFFELRGCTVENIEIDTPDSGGSRLKASGKCMYINRISDPSLTGSYESLSLAPFMRRNVTMASGDLASAAVAEDLTIQFNGETSAIQTFGGGALWPNLLEYAEGVPTITGTIQRRRMASADWDAVLAATRYTLLAQWVHQSFITGSYPYKIAIQGSSSAAYTGGSPDALTQSRRTGASYDFKLTRDAAISSTIEVVNATTSYA